METILSPHYPPPPPPSSQSAGSNLHMFYYGLVVAGMAAVVLVLYNLLVVKFCSERIINDHQIGMHGRITNSGWKYTTHYCDIPSFKYKKDHNQAASPRNRDDRSCTDQCVVCLSTFEEGEELRKLPKCKHLFHASCIDMWLYSHLDCPVCRTAVFEQRADVDRPGHSHEEVLGPSAMV